MILATIIKDTRFKMQEITDKPIGFRENGTLIIYESTEEVRRDTGGVMFWCKPSVLFKEIRAMEKALAECEDAIRYDPEH